ncbi:MAG: aminotransferase class I/II-fold pyridoxal phosphate-dependent enzyme [Acidimicrobiia bacterium]
MSRIYLSPPELGAADREHIAAALDEGWIAPVGPQIDAFERELAEATGRARAVALSSGTAALHLALIAAGVGERDRVLVSTLTFAATANAVRYVGAEPVFVDSDLTSWNMDPDLLGTELDGGVQRGEPYKAVIAVDLYGQCADYRQIEGICRNYGMLLISDAAEALGAEFEGRPAGSFGEAAVLSFNGNKIITTSGGGALVTDRSGWADQARFLATQARDPFLHYEHSQLGYNYRLSNLLAALGSSQLSDLGRRVGIRRAHNRAYREGLADLPGVEFMPEIEGSRSTFWLTALTIDPDLAGTDRSTVINLLESHDIEARPIWKPMHLQPLYRGCSSVGGAVAARLFETGLCLPSGSSLTADGRDRIISLVRERISSSSTTSRAQRPAT